MSDSLDLSAPLAPPAVAAPSSPGAAGALELSPPAPVPVVPDDHVDSMVPLDESTRAELRRRAAAVGAGGA
ncbi:MAG: toxic anion resistance protein, partial [Frankia sp.]|nr:toxic anion resistance protein [Frankia sp.]